MNEEIEKYNSHKRSEEVQHLIERMPTKFGFWVSNLVWGIFALLLVFGWLVRYPDVLMGQITINAHHAPIKLVANTYGKLKLYQSHNFDAVKENQVVAYLQNAANFKHVESLNSLLKSFNPNHTKANYFIEKLPKELSFGELNNSYSVFVNSLNEWNNYQENKLFDKQMESLNLLLNEQKKASTITAKRLLMNR
ncbi:MAG: hypothetical protein K2Q03_06885, partial [Sphingobacteriaceae bacterium]|nr:hypothetical protein [Sphingobacteriaceae bacterium]